MSAGVDLSEFFDTFFDEADELLADMEQQLLGLDIGRPDVDQMNAIFRAAHSIKGGAATFGCFGMLADTTHLLENLLDLVRKGEMPLRTGMIDLFLETKDVLTEQVAAYRNGQEPDAEAYRRICEQLRALSMERQGSRDGQNQNEVSAQESGTHAHALSQVSTDFAQSSAIPAQNGSEESALCVRLSGVGDQDVPTLSAEMALLGTVLHQDRSGDQLSFWLNTSTSVEDISAVCCFILNPDQVHITRESYTPVRAPQRNQPERGAPSTSNTIRVGVEKVDQIINLVGELVITQAMLMQASSTLDPVIHDRLLNGIEQLERNARGLQESVMTIRMAPMEYVFSRFPRVVRESAATLGKKIKLTTLGQATELDKSLIERIIDPLTHLVRNSIDHGIESPAKRAEAGKDIEGRLVLSAQHQGGQIMIEVSDDGAGLSRERILKKALSLGMSVSHNTPDDELWQLIFSPGFSTAEKVTEISGRGVGMDVVRRNIQAMGGHIQLSSRAGHGTTTRIVLPLTLAILDGMSVRVGKEIFILPLSHVTESIQPSADQIHQISDTEQVLFVRGEYLPLIALHEVFGVSGAQADVTRAITVILQAEDVRFALQVDHLVGQHQVVVKNLEANYRKIPGVSAATILGDGSVALIVDVFALMRFTRDKVTL